MIMVERLGLQIYVLAFIAMMLWYTYVNAKWYRAVRQRAEAQSRALPDRHDLDYWFAALRYASPDPALETLRALTWRLAVTLFAWIFVGALLPINFDLLWPLASGSGPQATIADGLLSAD